MITNRACIVASLLALLTAPHMLAAQTVEGVVRERADGRAVAGALVTLLGARDTARARGLTRGDGGYALTAPVAGVYRLRVERIGYEATTSPPLHLAAGDTLIYDPLTTVHAVSLSRIVVQGERRCVVRPAEGEAVATAWSEARKALEIARSTSRQHLVAYDLRTYRQRLDPNTLHVLNQKSQVGHVTGAQPFRSLPAARLARRGFIATTGSGRAYYAPDPDVLLSNAFLNTHCFRLATPQKKDTTLIGLHFEPVRQRNAADIEGTFWLDRRTDRLKSLRFHYTDDLDRSVDSGDLGGYEAFEALPSGAWIIRSWWIRAPQFLVGENRWDVNRVYQIGGEVTDLLAARTGRLAHALPGVRAGSVIPGDIAVPAGLVVPDTQGVGPGHSSIEGDVRARGVGVDVPGAVVTLLGADGAVEARERSDSRGGFAFKPLSAGTYTVSAEAPGFVSAVRAHVLVQSDEAADVTLWLEPQPFMIPKLQVEARRRDRAFIKQQIGMSVRSLRPLDVMMGSRLHKLEATSNKFTDLLHNAAIPGLTIGTWHACSGPSTICPQAGPCIELSYASTGFVRPACADVYVDDVPVDGGMFWTLDVDVELNNVGAVVVLRPDQAGALFGTGSSGGVVLIYTRDAMGLRPE